MQFLSANFSLIAAGNQIFSPYNLIIASCVVLILSFFFGELSKRTNIPSVLMLIILGILLKLGLDSMSGDEFNFLPYLEVLGIVGLIMIVLEAALELELVREKLVPIAKAFIIALIGLVLSAWAAAFLLDYFMDMGMQKAWIYATPISILSSAIIIPSVTALRHDKKEFHIYESTFSDILGIMMFYFLVAPFENDGNATSPLEFGGTLILTIVLSLIASYAIVIIFQRIETNVKLFLLIAVLLLLYALGKKMHLSSLIIILIFGLVIANMKLFFKGPLTHFLDKEKAHDIYHGLHVITMETAFVVRTFFFVVFGLTISLASLANAKVAMISILIIASIYIIRFVLLRLMIGKDLLPQLFIAPRGLITVLLFYAIPATAQVEGFESGVLLWVIIGTSVIMTFAMIADKRRTTSAVREAKSDPVGYVKWEAPKVEEAKTEGEAPAAH